MDNYDFTIGNNDIPVVNLITIGLSFNQACAVALGYPEYITVGLDRENKRLAVKAIVNDDKSVCRFRFATDGKKKKSVTVAAYKLRNEILKTTNGNPCRNGVKYTALFDIDKQMLIVDLKQNINK